MVNILTWIPIISVFDNRLFEEAELKEIKDLGLNINKISNTENPFTKFYQIISQYSQLYIITN